MTVTIALDATTVMIVRTTMIAATMGILTPATITDATGTIGNTTVIASAKNKESSWPKEKGSSASGGSWSGSGENFAATVGRTNHGKIRPRLRAGKESEKRIEAVKKGPQTKGTLARSETDRISETATHSRGRAGLPFSRTSLSSQPFQC